MIAPQDGPQNDSNSRKIIQDSNKNDQILNSVKHLLKNRVFSGCYKERRLIDVKPVAIYKDVIVIDESEYEFQKILKTANESLNTHFHGQIVTCITGSNNKSSALNARNIYSIWTNLSGVTLGCHWFLIKNVSLNGNVFNINVKYLRPCKFEKEISASSMNSLEWENFTINASNVFSNLIQSSSRIVTVENMIYFCRFLLILLLTLLIGSYRVLQLLVKYVQELNFFIRSMTPVFIAFIESVTKAFGGLLILIAMMWNNKSKKQTYVNMPPYPPSLPYQTNTYRYRNYTNQQMYFRNNTHVLDKPSTIASQ